MSPAERPDIYIQTSTNEVGFPATNAFASPGTVWHSTNVQISLKQSYLIIIDVKQLNVIHMCLYFEMMCMYACICMYIYIYMYMFICECTP